jgi:hypothetical protein
MGIASSLSSSRAAAKAANAAGRLIKESLERSESPPTPEQALSDFTANLIPLCVEEDSKGQEVFAKKAFRDAMYTYIAGVVTAEHLAEQEATRHIAQPDHDKQFAVELDGIHKRVTEISELVASTHAKDKKLLESESKEKKKQNFFTKSIKKLSNFINKIRGIEEPKKEVRKGGKEDVDQQLNELVSTLDKAIEKRDVARGK